MLCKGLGPIKPGKSDTGKVDPEKLGLMIQTLKQLQRDPEKIVLWDRLFYETFRYVTHLGLLVRKGFGPWLDGAYGEQTFLWLALRDIATKDCYDPSKGANIVTYLVLRARGNILNHRKQMIATWHKEQIHDDDSLEYLESLTTDIDGNHQWEYGLYATSNTRSKQGSEDEGTEEECSEEGQTKKRNAILYRDAGKNTTPWKEGTNHERNRWGYRYSRCDISELEKVMPDIGRYLCLGGDSSGE